MVPLIFFLVRITISVTHCSCCCCPRPSLSSLFSIVPFSLCSTCLYWEHLLVCAASCFTYNPVDIIFLIICFIITAGFMLLWLLPLFGCKLIYILLSFPFVFYCCLIWLTLLNFGILLVSSFFLRLSSSLLPFFFSYYLHIFLYHVTPLLILTCLTFL